jgi:hypothetical protein
MWGVDLLQVENVVDAIQDRNGKFAVVDTIIYALMSLRQTSPSLYYFSVETQHPGEYHYFVFLVGKGPVGVRIVLMNRFGNRLFMNISDDGTLRSVVDGNWDYEKVRSYLCRHITADPEHTVHGDYNRVSHEAKQLFSRIQNKTTRVLFKRRTGLERLLSGVGVELLPAPVVRNKIPFQRKWKRTRHTKQSFTRTMP